MAKLLPSLVVAAAFLAPGMVTGAQAYLVSLDVGALSIGDGGHVGDSFTQTDGVTAKQIETGAVTGDYGNLAEARAAADLATGELKVYVTTTRLSTRGGYLDPALANGYARFDDTVRFDFPGPATSGEVTVALTVDGSFTNLGLICSSASCVIGNNLYAQVVLGPLSDTSPAGFGLLPGLTTASPAVLSATGMLDEGVDYTVRAIINPSITNPNDSEVAFDLMNTASVSFVLPAGATFTSGSQVLLTQVPGGGPGGGPDGLPEPGTLALFGLGLAALGLIGRGRATGYRKSRG